MPLISITFLKMLKGKVGNENMSFMTLNLLSHNNYCSVGVMEICLLNLLILIDCFCVILMLVCSLRACHMWLTRNHMFKREIWGQFTSFIFWNFQISLVSFGRYKYQYHIDNRAKISENFNEFLSAFKKF